MTPKLCLGTAQFGQVYGITNTSGQVSEATVGKILAEAEKSGINWLDTAQAYGNAEAVLGHQLPTHHHFHLVSKLPAQSKPEFNTHDADIWEQSFFTSCQRLSVTSLDSLLLHSPADLSKPGGHHLEHWLLGLRERRLVKRLGISIYSAEDLEMLNPALLDLVQLPLSLYDQRMLQDGTINRLRSEGTTIHIRSVYLQGLLLTPAQKWPTWVNPQVRARQQKLQELAEQRNCQLIDLALGFARDQEEIDGVVLGICSVQELTELTEAWSRRSPWIQNEWKNWALHDPIILDPREWPS